MMLVAAFLCAAAAAVLARSWMANQGSDTAAVKQETAAPTATVIVAARDLKPGDKLTAESLKEIQWPAASMPKGTFSTKDAVLKASGTHGVYTKVWANQPLLAPQLSLEGQDGMLADRLAGDLKGVSIRVNDVAGVSGFVQPEDRIDVLLTTTAVAAPASEAAPAPAVPANAMTRTILRNVRVLATDQQTQRKAAAVSPKTVTVEVNAVDAAKLTLAMNIGQLSLVLNRSNAGARVDAPPLETIRVEDLLNAEPKTPAGDQSASNVVVTRSMERKEYKVQPEGSQ